MRAAQCTDTIADSVTSIPYRGDIAIQHTHTNTGLLDTNNSEGQLTDWLSELRLGKLVKVGGHSWNSSLPYQVTNNNATLVKR